MDPINNAKKSLVFSMMSVLDFDAENKFNPKHIDEKAMMDPLGLD